MSRDTAFELFVAPMRRRFTIPTGIDQVMFLDDLADALAGYGVAQLSAAATWFRDNRDVRAFPTLAECRRVCERFPTDEQRAAAVVRLQTKAEQDADWRIQREREIAAWKLCRCGMGREADSNGWLPALIEFCVDNGRLPERSEVGHVQQVAERSERSLAALKPVRPGPDDAPDPQYDQRLGFYSACLNWRKIMLDRAHERVFGWMEKQAASESHLHPATERAA